jgi:drug/metabolite transporter (DMT)-like permease
MEINMKRTGILEMMVLGALSSTSYLFYKLALDDVSPFTLVSLRVGIGGFLLLLLLKLKRINFPSPKTHFKFWKHCFVLGFFTNGFPFVCFCYSLTTIHTSLSALINGMTPVLTVILANLFLEDERLTLEKTLGIILGLAGFGVLFIPALIKTFSSPDAAALDPMGIMFSFLGSCSYAVGIIYARKFTHKSPPFVVPTLQLLSSLLYLLPLAILIDPPLNLREVSFPAWGGILGLCLLGTVCAFVLYHHVLTKFGVTTLAMSNYLLPIFGTLLGVVFLKENLSFNFLVASLLILLGIASVNGMLPLRLRAVSVPPS